jgi:hypothetical protein
MPIQQAVDRREVNVVADSLLTGSLDLSSGGNLALDRSRKKGVSSSRSCSRVSNSW